MDNFDDKYKKKNPFTVPERYWDGLTERICNRVEEQDKPEKVKMIQVIRPYMGLVAIFLLALLVVQVIFPKISDEKQMLVGDKEQVVQTQGDTGDENIFDSQFNPTSEEIIEYLALEVDNYELMYAGVY